MSEQTLLGQAEQIIAAGGVPVLMPTHVYGVYKVLPYQNVKIGSMDEIVETYDTEKNCVAVRKDTKTFYPTDMRNGIPISVAYSVSERGIETNLTSQKLDRTVNKGAAIAFALVAAASTVGLYSNWQEPGYLGYVPSSDAQPAEVSSYMGGGIMVAGSLVGSVASMLFAGMAFRCRSGIRQSEDALKTRKLISSLAMSHGYATHPS